MVSGEARGRFVVLDGVDGSGKSTQAQLLVRRLGARPGRPAPLHLREPGGTDWGEGLRALLLREGLAIGAEAEALAFTSARRQMLDELVRPALESGRDVVCERFHPSTYAYQAVAGGVDRERLSRLLDEWAGEPRPDRIVVLDLAVETAQGRLGSARDRIEAREIGFHARTAEGFREYVDRHPARAVLVSAEGSQEDVAAAVWEACGG